jgi:3-deoxy-manno-octulosonate cytidylyltransferase (CMP-KDO synthetase)
MRVLGIIPSRFESSRFPGKPLIDLKGKSMIQRVYEGASSCNLINDCIVATDDQRILDHVQSFGGKVMMTSDAHRSGTDRCGEIINTHSDYDVVINIQGDEPLVDPKQLEQIVSLFKQESTQIATLAKKIDSIDDVFNPNRIKVVLDHESNGLYFSRNPIPFCQNAEKEEWMQKNDYLRHIGIYAYKSEILKQLVDLEPTTLEKIESLEQLRWIFHGFKIKVGLTEIETPNIDTPEDVKEVLKFL